MTSHNVKRVLLGLALAALIASMPQSALAANGIFSVVDGRITDPKGAPFTPHGFNLYDSQLQCCAASALTFFPKTNFIRLNAQNTRYLDAQGNVIYVPIQQLQPYVERLTQQGIVVVIEDHVDIDPHVGAVYTGAALTAELNWYASLATTFKNNPNVWFGTINEPDVDWANPKPKYTYADIIDQQRAIYHTIRAAGNANPILMEVRGGWYAYPTVAYAPTFAQMTNIVWDLHYGGWITNFSTNQLVVNNALVGVTSGPNYGGVAVMQNNVKSKDGVVPVILGEYGVGSSSCDPNADQVLFAAQTATKHGYGAVAWHYHSGVRLVNDANNARTNYGYQVYNWMLTGVSSSVASPCS